MKSLRLGVVALVLGGTGCGLTLDYFPPDPQVGIDAGRRDAGSRDAGPGDAGPGDGAVPECELDEECSDDDPCNGVERCTGGRCEAGPAPGCADPFDCTTERCEPSFGCRSSPDDSRCEDDGLECTVERCDPTAGCVSELAHAACDDGIACTEDVCDPDWPGGCRHAPIDSRCGLARCDLDLGCVGTECELDTDCVRGPCDATAECVLGRCERTPVVDDRECDDGNPCTSRSVCVAGSCVGREETLCPGQPCMRCNPTGGGCDGSAFAPAGTSCNDGNACTRDEACNADGACVSGVVRACPSLGPCRTNSCDPSTGLCAVGFRTGPCDDLDACTDADTCDRGTCVGTPRTCEDTDPNLCTVAACNRSTGLCEPRALSDGERCASNATCAMGECECLPGYDDCDGDRQCECFGSCSSVAGSRTCLATSVCAECPGGQLCCPCTGACYDPLCLSCCMFCDP